jgi:hypothetical protein
MPPGQISAGDEPLTNQKRGGLDLGVLGLVSSNFHQLNFTCVSVALEYQTGDKII